MHAGQGACEVGDGSDHRGPGLARAGPLGPVVAARVESQGPGFVQSRNRTFPQIDQPPRGGPSSKLVQGRPLLYG
jgi:hypothetical protein